MHLLFRLSEFDYTVYFILFLGNPQQEDLSKQSHATREAVEKYEQLASSIKIDKVCSVISTEQAQGKVNA